MKDEDLIILKKHLETVLIVPKEEFFAHASYKQIQLVNSYEYWRIAKEVQQVVVAHPSWYPSLPKPIKNSLNCSQLEVNRGLILPLSLIINKEYIPKENILERNKKPFIVLQRQMWEELSYSMKINIVEKLAAEKDSWECYELPAGAPAHLRKYANTFPLESGSNCLSATLFAISAQEWLIHEWVHPQTFLEGLKNANYVMQNDVEEVYVGDVVVWKDSSENIQHASYHIGDQMYFNKDGQTFFNPWKIVSSREVNEEWKDFNRSIYRKMGT
ncbi:hypothetical protein FIU87_13130 [Bacillus sp. THAF10]|nr:hypothetical protein FIU87_13130 [Bacillus sp. THAF10]